MEKGFLIVPAIENNYQLIGFIVLVLAIAVVAVFKIKESINNKTNNLKVGGIFNKVEDIDQKIDESEYKEGS
ncbi:hypothetical protein [Natroniella sp. ANB-PHB2]|uniref:hypothetical protein n=1 Tax=Natroniella sp. ANB-PHB2 TaxID=3384444 RepID=UPI0038D4430F